MSQRTRNICLLVACLFVFQGVAISGQDSGIEAFKRSMMPVVGKTVTVEGVLQSAKLGYLVQFGGWGIYIYNIKDGDMDKMSHLFQFNEQTVKVTGTLRYAPASEVPDGPVVSGIAPEHFYFDVSEIKLVPTQKSQGIREVKTRMVAVAAAPSECLETFRQFLRYVQQSEPSIVKDETAQTRWLSKNLREALKQKVATFKDQPNDPDFPGNGTFVGTWDSPTTFSIVGSRRYDKRAVIDVWYSWGKGTNYPGDTRLSYFVFVLEEGRWKLDDVYTFRGAYASAESLNAYLTSK